MPLEHAVYQQETVDATKIAEVLNARAKEGARVYRMIAEFQEHVDAYDNKNRTVVSFLLITYKYPEENEHLPPQPGF